MEQGYLASFSTSDRRAARFLDAHIGKKGRRFRAIQTPISREKSCHFHEDLPTVTALDPESVEKTSNLFFQRQRYSSATALNDESIPFPATLAPFLPEDLTRSLPIRCPSPSVHLEPRHRDLVRSPQPMGHQAQSQNKFASRFTLLVSHHLLNLPRLTDAHCQSPSKSSCLAEDLEDCFVAEVTYLYLSAVEILVKPLALLRRSLRIRLEDFPECAASANPPRRKTLVASLDLLDKGRANYRTLSVFVNEDRIFTELLGVESRIWRQKGQEDLSSHYVGAAPFF
ncbi:hypothetical protein C8J56DRAFT_882056 [Mycena floridula]|nr:hypothetical protein C8J56DRAFT_882056 [Mycena floridula]